MWGYKRTISTGIQQLFLSLFRINPDLGLIQVNHYDFYLLIKKTRRQNRLGMLVNNNDLMIIDAYSIYAKDKVLRML
jgi:hypothetical protein